MNKHDEQLTPVQIGERLRLAREEANKTQAEAAAAIDVARTTLVAIEQGQRRARIEELQRLAALYKSSVNALLRREAVCVDLFPRFRKLPTVTDGSDEYEAARLLAELSRAEVELENLLGIKRLRNYPPERAIMPGDVRAQAEQDALELRQRLGLGLAPITDIVTLFEMELSVRVFVRRIRGSISGLFAYDDTLGACILLNANHPRDRRAQTGGHELGHFIGTRQRPEILYEGEESRSRGERYADAFGRTFLAPPRAVMQKFRDITAGASKLTRRHVIVLAHFFGISREAMVRRLEELGLTKSGTWDWFVSNGGITDEHVRQVLGDLVLPDTYKSEADRPTTLRLSLLAAEVHKRGLLSEGQLARLLHLTRLELREIIDGLEPAESDADGVVSLD